MRGTKTEVSPGVWRLRVYAGRRPQGTPIQITETLYGPDKKEGSGSRLADRRLAKMVSDVSSGKLGSGVETFGRSSTAGWTIAIPSGRSPTTMKKYRQIVAAVVRPELGNVRLSKLTAGHLDKLYAKLTEKGNKATTIRRVHALIGAALDQADHVADSLISSGSGEILKSSTRCGCSRNARQMRCTLVGEIPPASPVPAWTSAWRLPGPLPRSAPPPLPPGHR